MVGRMTNGNGLPGIWHWIGPALLVLVAVPAAGHAATIARDPTTLRFTAAKGEANQTQIVASGTDIVISDPGAPQLLDRDGPGGCVVAAGTATCPSGGLTSAQVKLRDLADSTTASGNLAPLAPFTYDAGAGDDTVRGGNGADVVIAGVGSDFIDGNQGNDFVLAHNGNDTMQWDPGDGNDTLEGQDGRDRLIFNGNGAPENVDVSANGGRVRLTRDVAAITMDLDDVEEIDHNAQGAADNITVNDLSGTDLTDFREELSSAGAGDGQADNVIVNGTNGVDEIAIAGTASTGVDLTGLVPSVAIRGQEPANDRLTVHTLGGDDVVDTDGLAPGSIGLTVD
jgi:Ca2+-binding RTX toxin-like protein